MRTGNDATFLFTATQDSTDVDPILMVEDRRTILVRERSTLEAAESAITIEVT